MRLIATDLAAMRGGERIFEGVSFEVAGGRSLVVTGPNGAGKSTLLRIMAGLLRPETGTLRLEGGDGEARLAEETHYLGHLDAMKRELTVRENLEFWRRYMGGGQDAPARSAIEAADAVGLAAVMHLPFGCLSAGQQRRIAIAKLLLARRPVWLLDEPTGALDAASEAVFAGIVARHCGAGGILVAATHRLLGLDDPQRLELERYRAAVPEDLE